MANNGEAGGSTPPTQMDVDEAVAEQQRRFEERVQAEVNRITEGLAAVNTAQQTRISDLEAQLAAAGVRNINLSGGADNNGLKKLFGKPARFSGTDKNLDVREWLFMMKLIVEASKETDEAVKVAFCASNLDGKARSHWLHAAFGSLTSTAGEGGERPKLIPYTMESFENTMLAGFGHVDPVQVAWVKLNSISQGMNDPPEYARQFQALIAELGPSAPMGEALIQYFLRGLHPKLKAKVELKIDGTRWLQDDLQALIRQCTALWPQTVANVMASKSNNQNGGAEKGKASVGKEDSGKQRKGFNKSLNAVSTANSKKTKKGKLVDGPSGRKLSREQIKALMAEGKCFACEQAGHRATDPACPKFKGKSAAANAKGSEN